MTPKAATRRNAPEPVVDEEDVLETEQPPLSPPSCARLPVSPSGVVASVPWRTFVSSEDLPSPLGFVAGAFVRGAGPVVDGCYRSNCYLFL